MIARGAPAAAAGLAGERLLVDSVPAAPATIWCASSPGAGHRGDRARRAGRRRWCEIASSSCKHQLRVIASVAVFRPVLASLPPRTKVNLLLGNNRRVQPFG